jgi:O-methyltransferase
MLKQLVNTAFSRFGYRVVRTRQQTKRPRERASAPIPRYRNITTDMEAEFIEIYNMAKPYTMTTIERSYGLFKSVEYINKGRIEGDMVECGVWRGGSAMIIARSLMHFGDQSRKIYLYDTFEGMSEPTMYDIDFADHDAKTLLETSPKERAWVWAYASLGEATENLRKTGYPEGQFTVVKGRVEDTIPDTIPERIALLRLDTDWYESTKHELTYLYPLVSDGGIVIVDDYGHWQGARKAVDEFLEANSYNLFLHRLDYTGRLMMKQ